MPLTFDQLTRSLRDLGGNIPKDVLIPALQAFVQPVQFEVRERFTATTLAHKIAAQMSIGGGDRRNRTKQRTPVGKGVYTSIYTREEYATSPALRVVTYGLAALLEEGGRTEPHEILPHGVSGAQLGRKSAAFYGRSAALKLPNGFARKVNHPGSRVRAHHIIGTVLLRIQGPVNKAIEKHLQERLKALQLA